MNYANFGYGFGGGPMFGFILLMIWSLFWKGLALWQAAKRNERNWFIVLLVVHTFGILEIVYLFHFVKMKFSDIRW